jgi:Fic family protein
MALARSEDSPKRFYSLSAQIRLERKDYYSTLEWTQKDEVDVTRWQTWFLECFERALDGASETLSAVMTKARLWERFARAALNDRQIKILNRVLDNGMIMTESDTDIRFTNASDAKSWKHCRRRG